MVLLMAITVVPRASSELQNVMVNGYFSLPESERFVRVTYLPLDEPGAPKSFEPQTKRLELEPTGYNNRAYHGHFTQVPVPERPSPRSYARWGRVALSFYFGVPDWTDGAVRDGDLMVDINGHQEFSTSLSGSGWQPRLIDLGFWAGETVSITFFGAWMDGDPLPVVIALPRIVAWHGPYYAGKGGLNAIGPHGGRCISTIPDPPTDLRTKVGVDGALIHGGPLVIEAFSVYHPSTIQFKSTVYEYSASLREGSYWMPLPLAPERDPKGCVWVSEGDVEAAAIDIIPNFMVNDAEFLRAIETQLAKDSGKPTEVQN
jgi:hypothetical protein